LYGQKTEEVLEKLWDSVYNTDETERFFRNKIRNCAAVAILLYRNITRRVFP